MTESTDGIQLSDRQLQQAWLLLRLGTADTETAFSLMQKTLQQVSRQALSSPAELHFRRLLVILEGILLERQHQNNKLPPISPETYASAPCAVLQSLPLQPQQSFLLQHLLRLPAGEVAIVLDLPPEQLRHPLFACIEDTDFSLQKSSYRHLLRHCRRCLRDADQLLDQRSFFRLQRLCRQELANPLKPELFALNLWQRALGSSVHPTGIALLIAVALLILISAFW